MNVLIIGGGGREHALAWKVAQSARVERVFVAPGNAGTAAEPKVTNIPIKADDLDELLALAQREHIDLTIVGPEQPLVAGLVDRFLEAGLRVFGPTAAAAQLEGSKAFAKDFLHRHGIPTARYGTFTDVQPAVELVRALGAPVVVKADGLAAGKGVIVAQTLEEAEAAVCDMLSGNAFGEAGSRVVVEEFLAGEEASFICVVGGGIALPLASSQDHKRRNDGDQGPNTGGMGAYSPAPVVTPAVHARVLREVIEPTVRGLAADGIEYTGFLYAGLMIDADGAPRVIEFNCRLGDPETQPILMRLKSDLIDLIDAALDGALEDVDADWDARAALGVVLAAGDYPAGGSNGAVISGIPAETADGKVFHAGTALDGDDVVTAGGRVLCAVGLGDTVGAAQRRAYELAAQVRWAGVYYRKDIGYRAVARESD